MHTKIIPAATAAGVLALTACSSSTSGSGSSAPPTKAQLNSVVLKKADAPTGWSTEAESGSGQNAGMQAALDKCVGVKYTPGDEVTRVQGPDFTKGAARITSSASSLKSQDAVKADMSTLKNPKVSGCYGQLIGQQVEKNLPSGATLGSSSIKVTPGSNGGPKNVVATATGTIVIKAQGQQVPVYLDVAFITGRQTEVTVTSESPGVRLPSSVLKPLIAKVASRADKL